MSVIRSWAEHPEPNGDHRWHDCVYSAYLSALEGAGLDRLAGVNRTDEREALERSQTVYAPEAGSSLAAGEQAVTNRYGVAPHRSLSLGPLLDTAGLVIVAAGINSRLPARLHHWDPAFTGSHAVVFATPPGRGIIILDPEAPDKYAGDSITRAEALYWWDRTTVRYWRIGELEGSMRTVTVTEWPQQRVWRVGPGKTVEGYALDAETRRRANTQPADKGSWAHADAIVTVEGPMDGAIPAGRYYRVADGYFQGLYVPTGQVSLDPPAPDALRTGALTALRALQDALA
jgi:hypothetical protein